LFVLRNFGRCANMSKERNAVRIARIDIFQQIYTLADGVFVMSGGKVAREQDSTIVRLETDDGLVGWGEQCVFSPNYLAAHGSGARAALEFLAPAVTDLDPTQVDVVYERMEATLKGHSYAKSALDMACWDVFGKATNMRVSDLLGGTLREEIPLYTGVSMSSPEDMRADCTRKFALGYKHFQLKVGDNWRNDIARVSACLEVLGDAETVIVDANGYWSQQNATRVVSALAGYDVYIEQPCATIEECARVRHRSSLPFILDESLTNGMDIVRAYEAEAMDAVRLKLSSFGGITQARRARDLCATLGLAMTIEDSGGGDIVSASMAHLSASISANLFMSGFFVGEMVNERLTDWSCLSVEGLGHVPQSTGLGIVIDETRLSKPVFTYTSTESYQ
jgi:L-alanine-DL-glutamate epimerase-like enolase superfamily enzyme